MGLWPNPASDKVVIHFGCRASADWNAAIYSPLGGLVQRVPIHAGEIDHTLATSTLTAGYYLLALETPEGRWTRTLIIR